MNIWQTSMTSKVCPTFSMSVKLCIWSTRCHLQKHSMDSKVKAKAKDQRHFQTPKFEPRKIISNVDDRSGGQSQSPACVTGDICRTDRRSRYSATEEAAQQTGLTSCHLASLKVDVFMMCGPCMHHSVRWNVWWRRSHACLNVFWTLHALYRTISQTTPPSLQFPQLTLTLTLTTRYRGKCPWRLSRGPINKKYLGQT